MRAAKCRKLTGAEKYSRECKPITAGTIRRSYLRLGQAAGCESPAAHQSTENKPSPPAR